MLIQVKRLHEGDGLGGGGGAYLIFPNPGQDNGFNF